MKPIEITLSNKNEMYNFGMTNLDIMHGQTFKMMNYVWNKTKSCGKLDLFIITLTDDIDINQAILTLDSNEWERALELALLHFELVENYEMCSKVIKLMKKIKKPTKNAN